MEAPDKSTGKCCQTIHIKYDGIGFVHMDVLMNGKRRDFDYATFREHAVLMIF